MAFWDFVGCREIAVTLQGFGKVVIEQNGSESLTMTAVTNPAAATVIPSRTSFDNVSKL